MAEVKETKLPGLANHYDIDSMDKFVLNSLRAAGTLVECNTELEESKFFARSNTFLIRQVSRQGFLRTTDERVKAKVREYVDEIK